MHVDTNSWKQKVTTIILWVGKAKSKSSLSGDMNQKSAVSQDWIDELSWFFFHDDTNSGKQEFTLLFFWTWSKMGLVF